MTPEQILLWKSVIRFGLDAGIAIAKFIEDSRNKSYQELLVEAKELQRKYNYELYDPTLNDDLTTIE